MVTSSFPPKNYFSFRKKASKGRKKGKQWKNLLFGYLSTGEIDGDMMFVVIKPKLMSFHAARLLGGVESE
jgi:hypothetical protein